jgi:hypothetical protein
LDVLAEIGALSELFDRSPPLIVAAIRLGFEASRAERGDGNND